MAVKIPRQRWSPPTPSPAQALNLDKEIGSLSPGMQADIIALDGDPTKDITAVLRVAFVMKAGIVYKDRR